MLPRSRAGEKVARATFSRKTQWFQHTFPLRPESGPAGSREILGGSRGPLDVPPGLSGGAPRAPSGVLLPGSFLQDAYSEIPLQVILLGDSSCRIPPPGFHFWNSPLKIPQPGFLFQDSSSRIFLLDSCPSIPLPGFLFQDSSSWISLPRLLLQDSSSRIPPLGFLLQDYFRIPLPGSLL